MDAENNGKKTYEQMDDLGWFSQYFWFNTHIESSTISLNSKNHPTDGQPFTAWWFETL